MVKSDLGIQTVSLDLLVESPFWCRTFVEDEEFAELVESVKRIGVIEPPVARATVEGKFEIVCGHRRVLAARKADLKFVLVDIRKLDDEEVLQIQLMENIHRKDLSDFEKAMFLKKMIDKFGYTQDQLAKKIGKNQAWVSRHLTMLKLDYAPGHKIEEVTERQARELLKVSEEKREEIIKEVEKTGELPSARKIRDSSKPSPINHETFVRQNGLVECEIGKHLVDPARTTTIEGHVVCLMHRETGKNRFTPKAETKLETKEYKPAETWEYRKAIMTPHDSKMQEQVLEWLLAQGTRGIVQHRRFPLVETEADYYFPECNRAVYLDGKEVHRGNTDRDDKLREMLEHRGVKVLSITYDSTSERETVAVGQHILEWLGAKKEA